MCRQLAAALPSAVIDAMNGALYELGRSDRPRAFVDATTAAARAAPSIDLEIDECFAGPRRSDQSTIYYMEASRAFSLPPGTAESGKAVLLVSGWIVDRGRSRAARLLNDHLDGFFGESTDDRNTSVQPFAVLASGALEYWIVANHAEDGIEYGIVEITPAHAQPVSLGPLSQ